MLDYQKILQKYPWIITKNQNCIISPDSDGFLCGLLMSHYFNWKIKGFYDGKILLIENGLKAKDCIFLDMEIFRPTIKSAGQHMLLYNKNKIPVNWGSFVNCIAANNLRDYDFKDDFQLKYPLGTIHLLLAIVAQKLDINISITAICPLLYTDGVFKNLFNYPENCLSWLEFLRAKDKSNPLKAIFFNEHYSVSSLMLALKNFFAEMSALNAGRRGGDKIKISDSKGDIINFETKSGALDFNVSSRAQKFLQLLASKTGWVYNSKNWCWDNFRVHKFTKGIIKPSQVRYDALMQKNPVSLAITSALTLEFTLDEKEQI